MPDFDVDFDFDHRADIIEYVKQKYSPENVAYIGTDSFEGIDLAIDHLKHLGHTKIALLNGSKDSMVTTNRHDAYILSMQNHGLDIDENLIAYGHYVEESAK